MTRRVAITLVEVLVVVVIIGILIGLLLPAVQSARESSRRSASDSDFEQTAAALEESEAAKEKAAADSALAGGERRIIYEAELTLVVEDLSATETQITRLVKEHGGYVADAAVERSQGEQLSGRWRVRVPVDGFQALLDELSALGVAESRRQTAQDVTEEFIDLTAQIENKKKLEQRIADLLKDTSGDLKDVIEVERELARVRGEIEQMEGRRRYLENRTDLTTVSISAREERDYVPPQAPSFLGRVKQAWTTSLQTLKVAGERLGVAAVYALPWIVVLTLVALPPWWYFRRRSARRRPLEKE